MFLLWDRRGPVCLSLHPTWWVPPPQVTARGWYPGDSEDPWPRWLGPPGSQRSPVGQAAAEADQAGPQELLHNQQAFVVGSDEDTPERSPVLHAHAPGTPARWRRGPGAGRQGRPAAPPRPVGPAAVRGRSGPARSSGEDGGSGWAAPHQPPGPHARPFNSVGVVPAAQDLTAQVPAGQLPGSPADEKRPPTLPRAPDARGAAPPSPLTSTPPRHDPQVTKARKHEEDDSLSDAGTYTIDGAQDQEVEEARKMSQVPCGARGLQGPAWAQALTASRLSLPGLWGPRVSRTLQSVLASPSAQSAWGTEERAWRWGRPEWPCCRSLPPGQRA